jgi:glycosyltransferase involved in cell wall biosynthesis
VFAVPVAAACRMPVVLSSQRAYRELTPGVYHRLLRITDFLVSGTVVNSDNLRRHLIETDNLNPAQLILCYNSVDLARFAPRSESAPEIAKVLPGLSPVIGSTAVMRPEKGVDTLLEAFAQVAPKFPKAGLLLLGGGPLEKPLEARAAELRLADRVHFTGPVTDVLPWLHRMDIFVLPSLSEALSNSLLEAMATGVASIASDVGGNPELIHPDSTGYLFPPGSVSGLAERLTLLCANAALRERLSQGARSFVSQTFSREASLSTLSAVYSGLLRKKGVLQG